MSERQAGGTHLPGATYRLQLHRDFPFSAAGTQLPYLKRLGITDVYLSPVWASTPGSTHGYDVTDHTRVNEELGGEPGLRRFAAKARELGLGVIVDFVPNHMGIAGGHNRYWEDVLMHGQASRYAHFFDIAWQPLKRALEGKVLLPFLGDQYGRVLERGELVLERAGGRFCLRLYGRELPLSPRSLNLLLSGLDDQLPSSVPGEVRAELGSVARSVENLPRSVTPDLSDADREARAQEAGVVARRLEALADLPAVARVLDAAVQAVNADPARLDALLTEQNYRLAYWKVAAEEINYRRFFDINDLAALRMEDPRVFEWAHSKLLDLVRDGVVQGVRLDHTDGLYDPAGYFAALQRAAADALGCAPEPAELPLYVVAEKILEPGEPLRDDWAVHGTTGYDFLAELNGVFVDGAAEEDMSGIYRRFTGDRDPYAEHLYRGKMLVQRQSLPGEVNVLAEQLERLSESDLSARDFTLSTLRGAIREVIACFPVYRTYVRENGERESGDDEHLAQAIGDARRRNRQAGTPLDPSVFDFLHSVLALNSPDQATRGRYAEFALKFQQLTGPVTAKGAEDTAFYRSARLLSLNEVGGDPGLFGTPLKAFHASARARAERWPHAMLAGSTHDTKRGEDTRARIHVLSELPQTWSAFLSEWSGLFRSLQHDTPDGPAPSLHDVYTLLQNALGAYPLTGSLDGFPERLAAYMLKAAREAKLRTSWAAPDQAYEDALHAFTHALLADRRFTAGLHALHERISPYGAQNGLSATLVRLSAPGVPDTYQGCEGWNQSLVDPDNRRPVDYARRKRTLSRVERGHDLALARRMLDSYPTGEVKQLVTWAALQARAAQPDLFRMGTYAPLEGGKFLLAFARELGSEVAVIVAPRLTLSLTGERTPWALGEVWGRRTLTLPRTGKYRNALTGERLNIRTLKVPLAKILEDFPLALLIREAS